MLSCEAEKKNEFDVGSGDDDGGGGGFGSSGRFMSFLGLYLGNCLCSCYRTWPLMLFLL